MVRRVKRDKECVGSCRKEKECEEGIRSVKER